MNCIELLKEEKTQQVFAERIFVIYSCKVIYLPDLRSRLNESSRTEKTVGVPVLSRLKTPMMN